MFINMMDVVMGTIFFFPRTIEAPFLNLLWENDIDDTIVDCLSSTLFLHRSGLLNL